MSFREEILSYYESLNNEAEAREFRAEWIIRRYALIEKRKVFFQSQTQLVQQQIMEKESEEVEGKLPTGEKDDISIWKNLYVEESDGESSKEQSSTSMSNAVWDDINIRSDVISTDSLAVWDDLPPSHQSYKADQNVSNAKDLLYPSNFDVTLGSKSSSELFESSEKREIMENVSTEGNNARNLIYAHKEDNRYEPCTLYPSDQNFSNAKDVLYPTHQHVTVDTKSTKEFSQCFKNIEKRELLGNSSTEGNTGRDIIYGQNHLDNYHNRETTKTVFYPSNQHVSNAKDVLYPSNDDVTNDLMDSVKSSELFKSSEKRGILGNSATEGNNARNLIYAQEEKICRPLFSRFPNNGQITKDLLYPSKNLENTTNRASVQIKDNTRDLIYSSSESADRFQTTRGIPKDEGANMKMMLYPGSIVKNDKLSIWNSIENTPLSIPISGIDEPKSQRTHEFEPPTTIKNLLYPVLQHKGTNCFHVIVSLCWQIDCFILFVLYPMLLFLQYNHCCHR